MKRLVVGIAAVAGACQMLAQITLVRDTWQDGTRTDPAAPTYSEMGVDSDGDGDLESWWLRGGSGTLNVVNDGTRNVLRGSGYGASSASWTTYFTPPGTRVTLNDVWNSMVLTWQFRVGDVNAGNNSASFRFCVVNTPDSVTRPTTDATPPNALYSGYAVIGNMGETFGRSDAFGIWEWTLTSAGALLATMGNWTMRANDPTATTGAAGYTDNTTYTFQFIATRLPNDVLRVKITMDGGNIGGDGHLEVTYDDTTPSTFAFDTFGIRPSNETQTATYFDTLLFQVDFIPEPAPGLVVLAGLLTAGFIMRLRNPSDN